MMDQENLNTEAPDTPDVPDTPQLTDIEQRAIDQGWRPKDQWEGDPNEWRTAKEFVDRGELFSKIHDLSSENKQIKEALKGLLDHHKKVKENEYQRAIDHLRQQKKEALIEGDADKVVQVEEAIDLVKAKQEEDRAVKQEQTQNPAASPVFTRWIQANSWYVSDNEMRQFADEIGSGYFQRNKGNISESELYEYVTKRVKQTYPDKFRGQGTRTPSVEANTTSKPKSSERFSLTDDEERVMKTFVRTGVMTKDEYITELKRVKGVS
jgi:hypothetical protein